jgi:hypothetical protein
VRNTVFVSYRGGFCDCSDVLVSAEFDLNLAIPVRLPARDAVSGSVLEPSSLIKEFVCVEKGEGGGAFAALNLAILECGQGRGAAGWARFTRRALPVSLRISAGDAVSGRMEEPLRLEGGLFRGGEGKVTLAPTALKGVCFG